MHLYSLCNDLLSEVSKYLQSNDIFNILVVFGENSVLENTLMKKCNNKDYKTFSYRKDLPLWFIKRYENIFECSFYMNNIFKYCETMDDSNYRFEYNYKKNMKIYTQRVKIET